MSAETYSMVKDWLLAEEQEATSIKGFSKPVKTSRVLGTIDDLAKNENYFHHEDDGVKISIEGNRGNKRKTKDALKRALAQLDKL